MVRTEAGMLASLDRSAPVGPNAARRRRCSACELPRAMRLNSWGWILRQRGLRDPFRDTDLRFPHHDTSISARVGRFTERIRARRSFLHARHSRSVRKKLTRG